MKILLPTICTICALLFLSNLGARDFWAPDEGDFAEVVTELKDNPIVPHLNGTPYGEKPPLFYYITYISKNAISFMKDEVSMRFSTAIFAIAGILFFLITVYRFFDIKIAAFSSFILMTTPLYYWQARYLQVDMVFSVFISCSLLSFFWFYNTVKKRYFFLFVLLMAFGFMTKGPLSVILILPILILFLMIEKHYKIVGLKDILFGIAMFIVITLPWYLAVYYQEGFSYLYENIIRQNFVRFFDAWSHKRPIYYYFTTLPLDYFPWSFFLPFGIYMGLKRKEDRKIVFFIIWSLWMFVFFSLSSGKISKYMLPALPPLSILTSLAFSKPEHRYNSIVFLTLSLLFFSSGIFLFLFKTDMYPEFIIERIIIGSILIASSVLICVCLKFSRKSYVFPVIVCSIVTIFTIANTFIYKKLNIYKSPRSLANMVKPLISDGTPWVYYGSMRGVYVYYIGKHAIHIDEHNTVALKKLVNMEKFYILSRKRDYKELSDTLMNVKTIFEKKIGDTPMVFSLYEKKI